MSKWVGVAGQKLQAIFEVARENQPCILFFDEMESLFKTRTEEGGSNSAEIMAGFLTQTEGVDVDNTGLIWIGATNLPWIIDSAVERRFGSKLYITLPDHQTRCEMIRTGLCKLRRNARKLANTYRIQQYI